MMSAYVKIPFQALILLTGVLVFCFYLFTRPPLLFNPQHDAKVKASASAAEYAALETRFARAFEARQHAALAVSAAETAGDADRADVALDAFKARDGEVARVRGEATALVKKVAGDAQFTDVNYVFPTFVVTQMPTGLIGLIIAAIFAAAMSSIAAELNSLATASVIDIYRRLLRPEATDAHYLAISRLATGLWGLVACAVAIYATTLGSLIEVVNRFGSFFYGSLLGVFVLAIASKRATANGAFVGLIAGMSAVAFVAFRYPAVSFLWHNVVGVVTVTAVGMAVSVVSPRTPAGAGRRG
jgi:Na+(H+)/acetate symporter ActP